MTTETIRTPLTKTSAANVFAAIDLINDGFNVRVTGLRKGRKKNPNTGKYLPVLLIDVEVG